MKRKPIITASVLSALLVTSAMPFVSAAEGGESISTSARLLGDANNDGKITISDVTAIQRHAAELYLLTGDDFTAADINGDGSVTIEDATILQRYLAEISVDYKIGEAIETSTEPTDTTETTEPTEVTEATEPTTEETVITGDEWKENTGVITLSNDGITVSGDGIYVEGNVVYITEGGDWEVVGTCDDGMIYINTGEEKDVNDKVKLRLNGMSLTNTTGPAIYFDRCKKAFITLESGTVNTVSDGTSYAEAYSEAKAAIHSDDSLEIKGKGTLNVNGNYKHGINSDDDILIENGVLNITSVKDALHANDDITLNGKNIKLTTNAQGDGLESEGTLTIDKATLNLTGEGKGIKAAGDITLTSGTYVIDTTDDCINGNAAVSIADGSYDLTSDDDGITGATIAVTTGTFEIHSVGKGINGDTDITLSDGTYTITSTDDCINGNGTVNIAGGTYTLNSGDEAITGDTITITGGNFDITTVGKGVKATTDMNISGGEFTINSTDDSVHSNGNITVVGGSFTISSGDDGIHADTTVKIEDGTIIINNSYEGVEGNDVIINGGTVYVVASDDGVNAAGGQDQSSMGGRPGQNQFQPGGSSSSNSSITINGGYVYVISSGDGIDSNGSLSFNGGTVIVQGPATGGNFSVDADGTVGFNGGTVIAVCSSQAMWEDISGKLGSAVMNKSVGSVSKNGVIAVTDSSGNVICAVKSQLSGTVGVLCYSSSATPSTAVVGGTYSGTFDSYGYATGGTISGGTSTTLSASSGGGGFQPGGPGTRP